MTPGRDQLQRTAVGMVWTIAFAAWTADWMFGDMHFLLERALRRIPLCLVGAGCCWQIKMILDRLAALTLGRRLAAGAVLCAFGSLAYSGLNGLVFYVIAPRWGSTSPAGLLQNAMMTVWVFFAWAALYFAIDADLHARETRLRLADAQAAALEARNQALVNQIGPHFLFNALNTVSGLILEGEAARAERVTVALAALLRRSMETDARVFVSLEEEMDAVRRYLEIEQNRFEDRLLISETIAPELLSLAVPPMILQPLVENAVRHGVARSLDPVRIVIAACLDHGMLRLAISDNARAAPHAPDTKGCGIGQANIRQRLSLLFGDDASLTGGKLPDGGYSALVCIPARADAGA
jgi:two-component system LytT family sensor kinase